MCLSNHETVRILDYQVNLDSKCIDNVHFQGNLHTQFKGAFSHAANRYHCAIPVPFFFISSSAEFFEIFLVVLFSDTNNHCLGTFKKYLFVQHTAYMHAPVFVLS